MAFAWGVYSVWEKNYNPLYDIMMETAQMGVLLSKHTPLLTMWACANYPVHKKRAVCCLKFNAYFMSSVCAFLQNKTPWLQFYVQKPEAGWFTSLV